MEKKTAFVAYSFDDPDRQKVRTILDFLNSFREIGFIWESAERAEVESVSSKVRAKIDRSEVFVGILTRRHPVVRFPLRLRDIPAAVRGRSLTQEWTAPPWILQEVGYALREAARSSSFEKMALKFLGSKETWNTSPSILRGQAPLSCA